jgi:Tfp pilus tip-associated adhesin PilY1
LFGTGQYLSGNDLSQSNTQTLYGIRDDGTLSGKTTISATCWRRASVRRLPPVPQR